DVLRPLLSLEDCCFVTGQDAITLTGPATVEATRCTLGRHAALFHHHGENKPGEASVKLRECYAFVVDGPAFHLERDTGCQIDAQDCIFSLPEAAAEAEGGGGVLVLQTGESPGSLRYVGEHNYYHNLKAFWKQASALVNSSPVLALDAFKK